MAFRFLLTLALSVTITAGYVQVQAQTLESQTEAARSAPSTADIRLWIQQLDSNEFVMRKAATENLIQAGQAAIAPLSEALNGSNLEVTTRAIHALRELSLQGDEATETEARKALERIARTRPTSASRLAADALVALNELRQQRAIDRLKKLGARIGLTRNTIGFPPQPVVLRVEIGPAWQGTAADLRQLRWIDEMEELELTGPQVTDAYLLPVEQLPGLRSLIIKNANITDVAIRSIRDHRSLTKLDLMYTPVTDRCLDDLKTLVNATTIRIFGTNVTATAALDLDNALAQAKVEHKAGAFLGVRCQQGPWPCEVTRVVEGSAADQAGVKAGDIIVEYGGNAIRDFDDLRKHIGQNKVGEDLTIQVIRGGQPLAGKCLRVEGLPLGITAKEHVFGCEVTGSAPTRPPRKLLFKRATSSSS